MKHFSAIKVGSCLLIFLVSIYAFIGFRVHHISDSAYQNLADYVAHQGQFTIISDTDHDDLRLRRFLSNTQTQDALAKAGVKNIFMEMRHEYQTIIDDLAAGRISDDDFVSTRIKPYYQYMIYDEAYHNLLKMRFKIDAELVRHAAQQGIKAYAVESQRKSIEEHIKTAPDYRSATKDFYDAADADARKRNGAYVSYWHDLVYEAAHLTGGWIGGRRAAEVTLEDLAPAIAASAEEGSNFFQLAERRKKVLSRRIAHDKILARDIVKIAQGEKSVIFYGLYHGAHACDLDENLPNASRIELYANVMSANQDAARNKMLGMQSADMITLDQGIVIEDKNTAQIAGLPMLPDKLIITGCE